MAAEQQISLTWNLDSMVVPSVSMARDLLRATLSDNVHPIVVAACEKFGNTVAMCAETRAKVGQAMRTPDSVPIKFIRGAVGFVADDSATQLSKTVAGAQFLGLAAALTSSFGPFEAAVILELLLRKSTTDHTLLPTARHLKDLLQIVEPRCTTCGFSESVTGWRLHLVRDSRLQSVQNEFSPHATTTLYRPNDAGIEGLVDGLRHIARMGDANKCILSISTLRCAPWTIAFTKWCLGSPPTVRFQEGGITTTIVDSPGSPIFILIDPELQEQNAFNVSVSSSLRNITDLIAHEETTSSWPQLVTIERYGEFKLQTLGFSTGSAKRALIQALPYCIQQISQDLSFYGADEMSSTNEPKRQDVPKPSLNPFPDDQVVLALASRIMGVDNLGETTLSNKASCSDLPDVRTHLGTLKCGCEVCTGDPELAIPFCAKEEFLFELEIITAEVLDLSLFTNPDRLLVISRTIKGTFLAYQIIGSPDTKGKTFVEKVVSMISSKKKAPATCGISDLLRLPLYLVGHSEEPGMGSPTDRDQWLMSSKHGQTVFPQFFHTTEFGRKGFLALGWFRGLIQYENEVYNTVLSSCTSAFTRTARHNHSMVEADLAKRPVDRIDCLPRDDYGINWWISKEDGFLAVSLRGTRNQELPITHEPRNWIHNLAIVRVMWKCGHDSCLHLDEPDTSAVYTTPLEPEAPIHLCKPRVSVVATANEPELQLLALACRKGRNPMVLRRDACLSCCLKFCHSHGFKWLIL